MNICYKYTALCMPRVHEKFVVNITTIKHCRIQNMFNDVHCNYFSMAECNTAVSPVLTHWRYCSLALSHRSLPTSIWYTADTGIFTMVTIGDTPGPVSAVPDAVGSTWTGITVQPDRTRTLAIVSAVVVRWCHSVKINDSRKSIN